MTRLHDVTITLDTSFIDAMKQSFASVSCALEQLPSGIADGLRESVLGGFVLSDDGSDLVVCEPIDLTATGATKLHTLKVAPSQRYNEIVSAIAACGDGYGIFVSHGWPILSIGSRVPIVAEARGESIAPGGGAA